jgi:hypothetical protein
LALAGRCRLATDDGISLEIDQCDWGNGAQVNRPRERAVFET